MWQKVKTFFHVFRYSLIPHSNYYSKIPKVRFRFSLKYFISLIVGLNLIFVLFLSTKYNPAKINQFIDDIVYNLNHYPADLEINLDKGRLITSYNRPYFLWATLGVQKKLLIVIDENAKPEKINTYNSIVLVTRTDIVMKTGNKDTNTFTVYPLSYISNQQITRKSIEQTIQTLNFIKTLVFWGYLIIMPLLLILLPLLSFAITIIYLLIISLIIYYIFKIYYRKNIHFKKTLQISLHAVTFPLILDYFLLISKPCITANINVQPILTTPVAFLLLLTVFVFVAVYETYQNGKQTKTSPHPPSSKTRK